MKYEVRFTRRADAQINRMYRYIAKRASPQTAAAYTGRLIQFCHSLSEMPNRGDLRSEIGPGVRVIGFERAVSVQFVVSGDVVHILNLAYRGQDYLRYFAKRQRNPRPLP